MTDEAKAAIQDFKDGVVNHVELVSVFSNKQFMLLIYSFACCTVN